MLIINVEGQEFYDEEKETFHTIGDVVLELEHSLVSLSKWESKFKKPFLSAVDKTAEETLQYIVYMIQDQSIPADVLNRLTSKNYDDIQAYIESPESATTFGDLPEVRSGRGETITSELIYYWLVAYNIPFEVETWHLNRVFSLVKICNIKNGKPKKMSRREISERNRRLNEERRAKYGTSG